MHWYLLYTHCRHEKKVKERLERERFETFLPVTERWSLKNHRKRIAVPLFPCYLLVRTEMNVNTYLKILKTQGVIGFFCNGGKPAIIPDEEVNTIQVLLKNGKDAKLCPNPKEEMRVQRVNGYLTASPFNQTIQISEMNQTDETDLIYGIGGSRESFLTSYFRLYKISA